MRRRLPLRGTDNTRDLGGYPVPGGYTAWGRTFRSDAPVNLSAEDVELLRALGVTTHIDLRTREEVERRPSAVANLPGFTYHHVDLCACMQMMPDTEEGVAISYFEMTQQVEPMARIFRAIAKTQGGLLFHCAAGKDRTGVVAAILLMLAGAGEAGALGRLHPDRRLHAGALAQVPERGPRHPGLHRHPPDRVHGGVSEPV